MTHFEFSCYQNGWAVWAPVSNLKMSGSLRSKSVVTTKRFEAIMKNVYSEQ